jgi:DNA polymerase lambda
LYDDLNSRIPREECRQLYDIIRAEAVSIDPKIWIEIMGSYRRGQETSGDVDILITRDTADGLNHSLVLKKLVDRLKSRGIITHDVRSTAGVPRLKYQLSLPHDWRALEAKWMGVGRLDQNSKFRRIGRFGNQSYKAHVRHPLYSVRAVGRCFDLLHR